VRKIDVEKMFRRGRSRKRVAFRKPKTLF